MPSTWSRRRFLAGTLLAGIAGCQSSGREQSTTSNERPTSDRTTSSQTAVTMATPTVDEVWVTDSAFHIETVDSIAVSGAPDGSRLVFATYRDDEHIDTGSFHLLVGDEQYRPRLPAGSNIDFDRLARSSDRVGSGQALVGFVVPVQEPVGRAVLAYGDEADSWSRELPAATRQRLTVAPEFAVRAFSLPDTVAPDEPIPADLTVANVGSGDGVFRAVAPAGGVFPTKIEQLIAAGEESQFEARIDPHGDLTSATPGATVNITLSWAGGLRADSVTIEASDRTATAN